MIGLGINLCSFGSGVAFSPLSLFAAGENGAWYDPSDISTMSQDYAGITPVSATGQPVGLLFDKRLGIGRGSTDFATNGGFNTDISGWTNVGGVTGSWDTGTMRVAYTSAAGGRYQDMAVTAGRTYEMVIRAKKLSGGANAAYVWVIPRGDFAAANKQVEITSASYADIAIKVMPDASTIRVYCQSVLTGSEIQIDSVSMREVLGSHAMQSGSTLRPLYQSAVARIHFDGVDDVLNTTFSASLGSACTVARAVPSVGASILTAQTIGTTYASNADHAGLIIINRALTTGETASVTAYLNTKAGL